MAAVYLNASMMSHYCLWYCAHTYSVYSCVRRQVISMTILIITRLTKLPQHLELCHSFIVGSTDHCIDSLPHNAVQVERPRNLDWCWWWWLLGWCKSYLLPDVSELFVVKIVGWEKPWSKPLVIWT